MTSTTNESRLGGRFKFFLTGTAVGMFLFAVAQAIVGDLASECADQLDDTAASSRSGAEKATQALKEILSVSKALSAWSLTVFAGSVAAIVSTSYLQPSGAMKWLYLLFLPGWFFLGFSMYYSNRIARTYLAALVHQQGYRRKLIKVNTEFGRQLALLATGFFVFFVWLVVFLFWWIVCA